MIISLDETKIWLRVDGEDDDLIIEMLIDVAENYLKNAVGRTVAKNNKNAKLLCLVLVADWFENREFIGKADNVRHTIRSLLLQLEYGSDESESV